MKKRKVIAVLFVLVLLSLAGCQKENWTVYEIAGADEDTVCFDYSGETYELSSIADYKREAAETSSKFVLGKQEYALRYDETCNREFLSYHEDIYKTEDKNATFYFREDTGDLSGVFVKGKALTISENKPKVKEDYLQLAESLLKNYIPVEEYEVTYETDITIFEASGELGQRSYRTEEGFYIPENDNETASYTITYTRYIGDYPSTDIAVVILDEEGGLKRLNIGEINAFQNKDVPTLSMEEINTLVEKKLGEVCKEEFAIQSFEQSASICISAEGEVYFLVSASPIVISKETKEEIQESCMFILAKKHK